MKQTTDKLTVGLIGVANFGAYRRARMHESGNFTIAALCDRNAEVLAAASAEENARAYTDYAAMLEHPGLEGIVISTGADSHASLAIAAMRKGLHVFVEKPLCTSVEEVEALRVATRETGRIFGMGHTDSSTDPLLNLAKSYIEEGRLGTVVSVEENSSHSGGLEIKKGDWRGLADRNPGGMLFQCGVHALHGLIYLFGPIEGIQAMMSYEANPNTETADAANVLLRFKSGLVGTLNCYHVTAYCHELRIFGTKGNLYLDTHKKLAWFQPRKRNEIEERESVEVAPAPASHAYSNLDSWFNGIRKGTPVYPGLEDGIAAVLPVFAAESAARDRHEVAAAQ
jgi:predicted dehydrogenase